MFSEIAAEMAANTAIMAAMIQNHFLQDIPRTKSKEPDFKYFTMFSDIAEDMSVDTANMASMIRDRFLQDIPQPNAKKPDFPTYLSNHQANTTSTIHCTVSPFRCVPVSIQNPITKPDKLYSCAQIIHDEDSADRFLSTLRETSKVTELSCVKYEEGAFCEVLNGKEDCEAKYEELVGNKELIMAFEKHHGIQLKIWDGSLSGLLMGQLLTGQLQMALDTDHSTTDGTHPYGFFVSAVPALAMLFGLLYVLVSSFIDFFAQKNVNRKGKFGKASKRARRKQRQGLKKQELEIASTQPLAALADKATTYMLRIETQIKAFVNTKEEELTTALHRSSDYIETFLRERRLKRSTDEQCCDAAKNTENNLSEVIEEREKVLQVNRQLHVIIEEMVEMVEKIHLRRTPEPIPSAERFEKMMGKEIAKIVEREKVKQEKVEQKKHEQRKLEQDVELAALNISPKDDADKPDIFSIDDPDSIFDADSSPPRKRKRPAPAVTAVDYNEQDRKDAETFTPGDWCMVIPEADCLIVIE